MYNDDGLGLALPAITGAISGISSLFGGGSKDAGRIQSNTEAYNQAISGNDGPFQGFPSAMEFLRVHSVMGDADGGWATQAATTDAMNKYVKAQQVLSSGGTATNPASGAYGAGGPVVAGLSTGPLLMAGAAALAIVMLSRKR